VRFRLARDDADRQALLRVDAHAGERLSVLPVEEQDIE
jgi:hypothetical protein